MASDDTEITLGMGKLLGLFFLLAAICGVFFSIGYSLGKSTGHEQALNDQPAAAATVPEVTASAASPNKPSAVVAVKAEAEPAPQEAPRRQSAEQSYFLQGSTTAQRRHATTR